MTRELDAVVESAERATQQILGAAEDIEDAANTLSASLQRQQEQALALDIQDNVLRIFEACNFQDLTGQRIAKVLTTLKFVEDRIAHMIEIWGGIDAFKSYAVAAAADLNRNRMLHGPKLDDDEGHVSQDAVDAMFATGNLFEHDLAPKTGSHFSGSCSRRTQDHQADERHQRQARNQRKRGRIGRAFRNEGEHQRRDRLHHQARTGNPPDQSRRSRPDRTARAERRRAKW